MFWDINYVCIVFLIAAVADFLNTFRNRKEKKKNLEYENQGKIWDILSIDKYPESYLGPAIKVTMWLLLLFLLLLPINSNSNAIDIWGVGRLLCFYFAMRTSAEFLIVRENREKARKLWKKKVRRNSVVKDARSICRHYYKK